MTIEVPKPLELALMQEATAQGISPDTLALQTLEMRFSSEVPAAHSVVRFKSSRGILAKYGTAPTAEEIDENRADMFRDFGNSF